MKVRFAIKWNYSCIIEDGKFPSEVSEESFEGEHLKGRSNNDVQRLYINRTIFTRFPNNIGEVFKNIKVLKVLESNLRKISKENLRQFPKLQALDLSNNQLEFLPGDLFEFNKKLKEIWFFGNKIKFIGAEILDGLESLEFVSFKSNVAIDCHYNKNDKRSKSLEKIKDEIIKKCKVRSELKVEVKVQQNLLDDVKAFLALNDFKDFTIKIDSKEFKVHKFLFAARSETFADLIRENPDASQFALTDISVETFESILNFIYTDEMPKDPTDFKEIYVAGSKLGIKSLVENMENVLTNEMKDENIDALMEIFNLGLKFESENLKLKAFEEIKNHFPGKKLKEELLEDPEKFKALVEAKKIEDQILE